MKVTHEWHHIAPSLELKKRWDILVNTAICAKLLGKAILSDQIYTIVKREFATWRANAEKECKKKSFKGWLGGGMTYTVDYFADPFLFFDDNIKIYKMFNPNELIGAIINGDILVDKKILFGEDYLAF